jgi:hypothetical protein
LAGFDSGVSRDLGKDGGGGGGEAAALEGDDARMTALRHTRGMPLAPTHAPSNAPTIAQFVSVSPPSRTVSTIARSNVVIRSR